jgi:hypothetical protein
LLIELRLLRTAGYRVMATLEWLLLTPNRSGMVRQTL